MLNAGNFRECSTITINNNPSNPQQPIHSLRLAPVRHSNRQLPRPSKYRETYETVLVICGLIQSHGYFEGLHKYVERVFKTARIAWNGHINYHQPSQTIIATKWRFQSYIMLTQPLRFGGLVADVLLLKRGQCNWTTQDYGHGSVHPSALWWNDTNNWMATVTNWWFQPPWNNISQIGLWFPTIGENQTCSKPPTS